jgi:hypothetical protein
LTILIVNINTIRRSEILPNELRLRGTLMYRRSTVPSGSKHVLSFLHAATGPSAKQFAIITFAGFSGYFAFFHPGLIPCMNKDPVMTCS